MTQHPFGADKFSDQVESECPPWRNKYVADAKTFLWWLFTERKIKVDAARGYERTYTGAGRFYSEAHPELYEQWLGLHRLGLCEVLSENDLLMERIREAESDER